MLPVTRSSLTVRLRSCEDLVDLLAQGAGADDDEAVDLLAHSLQCAAILERVAPGDLELQIAGLVHDVGTLVAPRRPETHAATGAAAVEALLGPRVAGLVEHHDQAKRFLVSTEPRYRHRLSPRSLETLRLQGGLLDPGERAELLAYADLPACLTLRRADDAAKMPGARVPGIGHWRAALERLARPAA
jgi:predicted HD phosphohydrolase